MTENLFQKLEEKVTILLAQLETLHAEINSLKFENTALKTEKTDSMKKLQGLISLLDSMNAPMANEVEFLHVKNEPATA